MFLHATGFGIVTAAVTALAAVGFTVQFGVINILIPFPVDAWNAARQETHPRRSRDTPVTPGRAAASRSH